MAPHVSPLLSPAETATALGVTTRTLLRWEQRDALHPIKLPSGHRRYKRTEVDRIREALAS